MSSLLPLLVLCLAVPATSTLAADLTSDEARCQTVLGPATDTLGAREAGCLARCDQKARAGRVPASSCTRPFAGAARRCAETAAERAAARMRRGCAGDCPECYLGGDCAAFGTGAIAATRAVVDRFAAEILCGGVGAGDARAGRCRAAASRVLGELAMVSGRCVVACRRRELRGAAAAGACGLLPATDPRTGACLRRIAARARHVLARECAPPPACLAPTLPDLVDRVQAQIVADYRLFILCGSPAPAFLE